ncbi:MerR family DNA-binding transcriptional regulator [Photobacterium profundum]|uniref:Transcriptional regulator, MerR family protein n=1 Tax=Photobacterium profundum 3TCK TaxID=314280 RepID=Q1Z0R8_9GAMM|nr:MerR family transcriptional regulator [Photobacterium profundum]EAS42201.1 transcriptional regulator, MerR family protein [Photobacterium profundum 3TCK]PSV64252.1 MerR family DNA-binding transcriptional regulator [Photobacterium profundum]
MLTVSQLAKMYQISRTTILYYERAGLLLPTSRSDNGYRWYGKNEMKRLEAIIAYRSYGVSITNIAPLLERQDDMPQEHILCEQFNSLEQEIQRLRQQKKAIVTLLEQPTLLEQNKLTKAAWVEIMKSAGLNEQDMKNWHIQFEKMEPEAHQEFLESLSIDTEEINRIRHWSKG